MPYYARIENNKVMEVAEFDSIESRFHLSLVWVECPPEVQQRWAYVNGAFIAPETEQEGET